MKTTLNLPDSLVSELKRRAAERGCTLSAVAAEALRRGVEPVGQDRTAPLPIHAMGPAMVDVADRVALFQAVEGIQLFMVATSMPLHDLNPLIPEA